MQPQSRYLALLPQDPQTEFWMTTAEPKFTSSHTDDEKQSQVRACCPLKETSAKGRVGEVNSVAAYDDITGGHRFQLVTWLGSATHGTELQVWSTQNYKIAWLIKFVQRDGPRNRFTSWSPVGRQAPPTLVQSHQDTKRTRSTDHTDFRWRPISLPCP
jgi:hypothetical protein